MDNWIDINKESPKKIGWYKVKTLHGEYEVPFVRNIYGFFQWIVPDEKMITHWKQLENNKAV